MFAMTVSPCSNIKDYWSTESDGIRPAFQFESILSMSYSRYSQIRMMFSFGPNVVIIRTFDNFRYIQNERMHTVFECSHKIDVDESTSGWHGKDEKGVDGPPALTLMMVKPESVLFMFKTTTCVDSDIIFAIEWQEGEETVVKRSYTCMGEKPTTSCILCLMDRYIGLGLILYDAS